MYENIDPILSTAFVVPYALIGLDCAVHDIMIDSHLDKSSQRTLPIVLRCGCGENVQFLFSWILFVFRAVGCYEVVGRIITKYYTK